MSHNIVHVEIPSADPKTSAKFYEDLFGWKAEHVEAMDYHMYSAAEGPGGGYPKIDENNKAGEVLIHVSTDDIETTLTKAEKMGAKTVVPKSEIPGMGWFAIFVDPSGNKIGIYTALPRE